jgi:hypothetical protein
MPAGQRCGMSRHTLEAAPGANQLSQQLSGQASIEFWAGKAPVDPRPALLCLQAPAPAPGPPKPNPKFGKQDLRRIKQQGPSVEDLYAHFEVEGRDKEGQPVTKTYDFVPVEVLGPAPAAATAAPAWHRMPEITFMEFFHGLRQRNWTSKYYDAQAEPWTVQFYKDRCAR